MTALAWRLTRLGGRSAALSTGLTALAVAVATLLLQFAVAANFAFAERAERTEWRDPAPAEDGAVLIATAVDFHGPDAVTRVDLAALGPQAPAPPGLERFPEPGEIWLSPALAERLEGVPDAEFLARYDGSIAGPIGSEALAHPRELLAVVGRDRADPVMSAERFNADTIDPRRTDGFDHGRPAALYGFYQVLMVLATVLMAVPTAIFGAAAARLTVARRDERLAALRLIGATPGQVVRLTLVETVLAAAVGAAVGSVAWAAATPAVARIPIDGGPWFVGDLWSGAVWMAAVAAAAPVMVAVSAVVGLRGVVISPLGVARKVRPRGLRAIRLAAFAAAAVGFVAVGNVIDGAETAAVALVLLAATIGALNLAGPWVVQRLGRVLARTARGPERLLAARRLAEDPKAAWRTVAGVVLAGFIAGTVALFPLHRTDTDPREVETLRATVPADRAEALAAEAADALDGVAEVALEGGRVEDGDGALISVTTTGGEVEPVRTVLTTTLDGATPERVGVDEDVMSNGLAASVRVGLTVVLAVVFVTAAMSAAVNGLGSVLDRRRTYRLLHLAGTPQSVLDRARRQETVLPLALLGGGSVLAGMALTAPMIGATGLDLSGAVILAATLAVGAAAVVGAGALSRPLLRSVMNDVSPGPD